MRQERTGHAVREFLAEEVLPEWFGPLDLLNRWTCVQDIGPAFCRQRAGAQCLRPPQTICEAGSRAIFRAALSDARETGCIKDAKFWSEVRLG